MDKAVAYIGQVDADGKFIPDSPNAFKYALRPFRGLTVQVTFEEYKPTRSDRQNRAWFGIVIKEFMGYMGERDKLYVHQEVCKAIGHYEIKESFEGPVKVPKSTRRLSAEKFSELYKAAQELGATFGIVIPDPESAQALAAIGAA
jgi:hypothetical protein